MYQNKEPLTRLTKSRCQDLIQHYCHRPWGSEKIRHNIATWKILNFIHNE